MGAAGILPGTQPRLRIPGGRYGRLVDAMPVPTRIASAIVLLLLVPACSARRPATSSESGFSIPRRHVLPNGVAIIVQEHHAADVAAVQLWAARRRAG
jgi:hypothetical protein